MFLLKLLLFCTKFDSVFIFFIKLTIFAKNKSMRKTILKYNFVFIVLIISVLATSCITSKKTNYLQNNSYRIPKYTDSLAYEEYKLIRGDRIFLRLISTDKKMSALFNGSAQATNIANSSSDNADLYTYMVKDDGNVELPVIGEVYLLGKTIRESKKIVQEAMAPYIIDKYTFNVNLVQNYFSIIGSQANNKYPITKEKMNIFQALAMAGDIDTYGDRSKIKIIREVNGATQIKTFDVRSKSIINSEFYYIQPNDVIYIQDVKERFFSVTSFSAVLSTFFSTLSFGIFIYNIADSKSK